MKTPILLSTLRLLLAGSIVFVLAYPVSVFAASDMEKLAKCRELKRAIIVAYKNAGATKKTATAAGNKAKDECLTKQNLFDPT